MASPADIIIDMIDASGLGDKNSESDWGIFKGDAPPTPTRCIVVNRTGGRPANPRWLVDYPSIQVLVRSDINGLDEAEAKADSIKRYLLGQSAYTHTSGDVVDAINMMSDIMRLPPDESGNPEFVVNFSLIVEPAPQTGDQRQPL
jgi:hypothetical protein